MEKEIPQKEKSNLAETAKNLEICIELLCPKCQGAIPISNTRITLNLTLFRCIFCGHKFEFSERQIKEIRQALGSLQNEFANIKDKLSEK